MALSISPAVKQKLGDLGICLSAANLCFMKRWYDLEHLEGRGMDYFRVAPSDLTFLEATLSCIAIATIVFWLVLRVVRFTRNPRLLRYAQGCGVLILIYPLESVRRYWNFQAGHIDWGSTLPILAVNILVAVGAIMVLRGNLRVMRAAQRTLMLLVYAVPVLLVEFAALHYTAPPAAAYQYQPSLPWLPASARKQPDRRMIWLVFDEFDQRLAFDQRPSDLKLPELDRFASESLVAPHAVQTADSTLPALPSLLSGKIFVSGDPDGVNDLMLQAEGAPKRVDWKTEPTVFQRARELGVNSVLFGWHHPYCRALGSQLTDCFATKAIHFPALLRETAARNEGLGPTVAYFLELQWINLLDLFHLPEHSEAERLKDIAIQAAQKEQFLKIRERMLKAAVDPRIGLLFLHLPAPHLFAIYDRQKGEFALSDHTTYWDNLALVDRTVGELRASLEQAGLWDSTSILISSDHGLRYHLWHDRLNWTDDMDRLLEQGSSPTVPFLLHIAGSQQSAVYSQEFSAVVSSELVLAVLSGEIKTPAEASSWLAHRTPNVISARHASATQTPR
jgi:hypothetical protein